MRYTDYSERYERQKLINPEFVTIGGVSLALYACPLIVDIKQNGKHHLKELK